ncbi:unnamed protein product [Adineta ricciae]|uniref:Uncharacterized protein n=1 Tax=Adineta ricciae TaxID=249248 RepID=A0A815DYJ7_ADIRI|nr:unnamed protein product [Adineta ricciae]CAF1304329.1 unnamed protein product [Adineta ricciae]
MVQLPPPPRFNLPPPPMPPTDFIDMKVISRLTCSSIRQQYQETAMNSRLIFLATAIVIVAILLLIITLIWLLFSSRKRKHEVVNEKPKISSQFADNLNSMSDLSTCSSRSYETVSYNHTGIYLDSVDTSATTCSTDVTAEIHSEYYQQYDFQPQSTSYYHVLNIPDLIPN